MKELPPIDSDYLLSFLSDLLNMPSPTGYAHKAIELTEKAMAAFPELILRRTRKGALAAEWPGARTDMPRAMTAHVDTLGAMVKEIKANGRLRLTKIGGYAWSSGERGSRVHPQRRSAARCAAADQGLRARLRD
jgi:putative aminopeptidase FrvX